MVTTAVRNDRNKKRKPKQDGCVTSQQSEELTHEEETLIGQVVKGARRHLQQETWRR